MANWLATRCVNSLPASELHVACVYLFARLIEGSFTVSEKCGGRGVTAADPAGCEERAESEMGARVYFTDLRSWPEFS